jgi:hypothetical protein
MNYENLMAQDPTEYDRMTNSKKQLVIFYEHPTKGDEWPVIVAFPDYKAAFTSNFYDTDDMRASHREYEPILNGEEYPFELEYGAFPSEPVVEGTFYVIEDSPFGKNLMTEACGTIDAAQRQIDLVRSSNCNYLIVQLIQD